MNSVRVYVLTEVLKFIVLIYFEDV